MAAAATSVDPPFPFGALYNSSTNQELCKAPKENGGTIETAAAAIRFRLDSMAFMATKAGDMQPKKMFSLSEFQYLRIVKYHFIRQKFIIHLQPLWPYSNRILMAAAADSVDPPFPFGALYNSSTNQELCTASKGNGGTIEAAAAA